MRTITPIIPKIVPKFPFLDFDAKKEKKPSPILQNLKVKIKLRNAR
ncbi:MAG: hypothetical protein QXY87_08655 [Saccharolobus sp.]|nr:hypothetical protein [Saccharolobus shibatae]MCH4815723.1 hypothetical protein [Saccharolobus shibatae]